MTKIVSVAGLLVLMLMNWGDAAENAKPEDWTAGGDLGPQPTRVHRGSASVGPDQRGTLAAV